MALLVNRASVLYTAERGNALVKRDVLVSLCEGMRTEAGSLCAIVHRYVDCIGISTL